jgi:hypothetical protein
VILGKIFGHAALLSTGEWTSAATVLVRFSPQPSSNSNYETVPVVGWYLCVTSDATGKITNYYLSDLHK